MLSLLLKTTVGILFFAYAALRLKIWLSRKKLEFSENPPESHWLVGHSSAPGTFRRFTDYTKEYGPAHYLRLLFWPVLHISDPKCVKSILDQDLAISKGHFYRPYRIYFSEGLTPTEGEEGRALRKHISPAFANSRLQVFVPIFNRVTSNLFDRWTSSDFAKQTENKYHEIDIFFDSRLFTIDVICAACGMKDLDGSEIQTVTGKSPLIADALDFVWKQIAFQRFLSSSNYYVAQFFRNYTANGRKFHQSIDYLLKISEEAVKKRRKEREEKKVEKKTEDKDFLDHFLDQGFEDSRARDMIMNFLLAATDTVSIMISWTLMLLAENTKWQERIYSELSEHTDNECAYDAKNPKGFGLIVASLKESMRLFPPVPFLSRKTEVPVTLEVEEQNGKKHKLDVPANQELLVNFWGPQIDKDKWENADVFDPSRFSSHTDGDSPRNEGGLFAPFSLGRRNCVGQTFALAEGAVFVARVLKEFQISVDDSLNLQKIPLVFRTSLQPQHDLKLRLRPRPLPQPTLQQA
eukprot:TRINITY_DN10458_c0_g1_i1.p1 TRINITY_DN10458_c0_g1~~TRINITY_DN10458_c0_g1_i1.p1  ORF type:complete len:535 (+),score=77.19 TRINITY_DN10458_c0_g1_i1:44-1606(+)